MFPMPHVPWVLSSQSVTVCYLGAVFPSLHSVNMQPPYCVHATFLYHSIPKTAVVYSTY